MKALLPALKKVLARAGTSHIRVVQTPDELERDAESIMQLARERRFTIALKSVDAPPDKTVHIWTVGPGWNDADWRALFGSGPEDPGHIRQWHFPGRVYEIGGPPNQ